jgi:crotonobetainyl-CoA:carnitine CoA-transferase CaiB-like acyl-CoA transferase
MQATPFLGGLRVLEIADGDPATAYGARLLAQFGAEVLCIEPPEGSSLRKLGPFPDGVPDREKSAAFFAFNFDKRGITLNLGTSTGRNCLEQLIPKADVLLFSGETLKNDALRLKSDDLMSRFPSLIAACVTPFGAEGPWASWKGSDLQVSAAGGASIGFGRAERPLSLPMGVPSLEGGLAAAAAVVAALLGRERDGVGDWIDASSADVWATIHCNYIAAYLYRSVTGIRLGKRGGSQYPHAVFPCKDGQVFIDCLQIQQWIRLVEMMGTPEWSLNPRYRNRRAMMTEYPEEVDALVNPWFQQYTRDELWAMARASHVPLAPLYDLDEILTHPHLLYRRYFLNFRWHGRDLTLPGLPFTQANCWEEVHRPSPELGQDNLAVLEGELRFEREDVIRMRAAGVI